ncbi:MAG: tetraacyldisaccharide 4'-kinase [Ignavibacteria bacterium GWC2_56_12]|nr:MAG: tetraacyldisaccharide 4'-kinase [Ignavibacteria bacterium GWC2_56_12]
MRRFLLVPLGWLYGGVVRLRNVAYDRGMLSAATAAVPVICVGNISAGGTGKTPLVEEIAQWLIAEGRKVGILSRGYGRTTSGYVRVSGQETALVGDEPAQISINVPPAVVAVDEDRIRGAGRLVKDNGVQVIVLDDGFQHRRLKRNLDIVAIRAHELIHGDAMLPAGNWREPLSSLLRAQSVVITQCTNGEEFHRVRTLLPKEFRGSVAGVRTNIRSIRRAIGNSEEPMDRCRGRRVAAFSGIGTPSAFRATLTSLGMNVVEHSVFPDHHEYSAQDIEKLQRAAEESKPDMLVTTQKDLMRLRSMQFEKFLRSFPVFYSVAGLEWLAGDVEMRRLILSV